MLPTHQGFGADRAGGTQTHDGLVVHDQLLLGDRGLQLGDQVQAVPVGRVH